MKRQLKRRGLILLILLLCVVGFSSFLNRVSFDPNFSMVDAVSSASKRSHRKSASKSEDTAAWEYSTEELALPDTAEYEEEIIDTENGRYVVLRKTELSKDTLVLLSDKEDNDYAKAIRQVAKYYESSGYKVEIREYSEIMMLSLAHAEHFDVFVLREEES